VRKLLDQAFSQPTVSKIYSVLREAIADEQGRVWDARARHWAEGVVKVMDTRSPTGMKIALGNYRQAKKDQDLKTQLNRDLAMTTAFLVGLSACSGSYDKNTD
jgi:3-hydroxyisobutyryl-CoA hydrolase